MRGGQEDKNHDVEDWNSNTAHSRGKNGEIRFEVCELDQEANISKRFLTVGGGTTGAADQRHRPNTRLSKAKNYKIIQHHKADPNYQS